jgi:uncharacterized peroxidase-related enzyme
MQNDQARYRMTLPLVDVLSARAEAREQLEQTRRQVGMIPNLYAAMANLPAALETYRLGYDRFRQDSGFSPTEQEVVFLTMSRENGCDYCVSAHSFVADAVSGVPAAVTNAIRDGVEISDPRLRALATFTRTLVQKRGWPCTDDARAFLEAGYTEQQMLAIVLAIAVKTISNYTNHLFATPLDAIFQARVWKGPASSDS